MTQPSQDRMATVTLLVEQLQHAAKQVERDDLRALAKMHGWCQELADSCRESELADVNPKAVEIAGLLESLILGESADVAAAFEKIARSVQQLAEILSSTVRAPLASMTMDPPASHVELDAETQMAKVFNDDPQRPTPSESDAAQDADAALRASSGEGSTADQDIPAVSEHAGGTESKDNAQEAYQSEPLIINASEVDFVKGFVEEAYEHIQSIETALLDVEREPENTKKIDDLFRPFHTIKGMAGFLNLRDINGLTHEAETLLDQCRKGQRPFTSGITDVIFEVVDLLKGQIGEVSTWITAPHGDVVPQPPVADIIGRLRGIVSGKILEESDQASATLAVSSEAAADDRSAPPAENRSPSTSGDGKEEAAPASAGASRSLADQSIRIDIAKMDALVDMVGELVIAQTMVNSSALEVSHPRLSKDVSQVSKIVRDVQEVAMSMRMVPIASTFQKMTRLVRDVSRKAGKTVHLTIAGEDTELDKTVIQQIGDPLVHMVRNAVDHGVEPAAERVAAGKPAEGHVHLGAYHSGGNIVIEISDDGRGLNPDILLRKAVEKGIVKPDEDLTEQEIFHLIFAPGFSTAKTVTDISGRGVGMDVVKRNIESLRGRVEIASEVGKGSTFTIRLPLTLAIIDGMVVRVGKERLIVPTLSIEQSLKPTPQQITTVQQRGEVLDVRGRLVPLLQLGRIFEATARIDPCEAMVVIAQHEGRSVGLVIDELIGQQQVVIKALGERFRRLKGISGAAVLGDGRIGLILEIGGLMELHRQDKLGDAQERHR